MLTITDIKKAVKDYFETKPVKAVYLFGSYARGSYSPGSDVDMLISFEKGKIPGLAFFSWASELEEKLGKKVDLISKVERPEHTNDWDFLKKIEKESTLIYEKGRE